MATTDLLTIAQEIARRLSLYESGTATGGSTTTVTAAAWPFKNTATNASTRRYVNDTILVKDTSAPTVLSERRIITYAPSTGILTVTNAFDFTMADTDTFDIFMKGITYTDIKSAINRALEKLTYTVTVPLTLITDGDMETSGTASWTATNTTHTKATSGFSAMRGTQCSRCVNSAADGNIQSGSISCRSDDIYLLRARVSAAIGTAELVAYDVTNSAEIETKTWDEVGEGTLWFFFTTPSTCEQIAIRLQGQGASDDVYWDDVILLRQRGRVLPLPSWIIEWRQVKRIYQATLEDWPDQDVFEEFQTIRPIPDTDNPNNQWKVWLDPAIHYPVYLEAERPYATLSAQADTTLCDKQLIILMGCWELLDMLINRAPGQETQAWKQEMGRVEKRLRPILHSRAKHTMRVQLNG